MVGRLDAINWLDGFDLNISGSEHVLRMFENFLKKKNRINSIQFRNFIIFYSFKWAIIETNTCSFFIYKSAKAQCLVKTWSGKFEIRKPFAKRMQKKHSNEFSYLIPCSPNRLWVCIFSSFFVIVILPFSSVCTQLNQNIWTLECTKSDRSTLVNWFAMDTKMASS